MIPPGNLARTTFTFNLFLFIPLNQFYDKTLISCCGHSCIEIFLYKIIHIRIIWILQKLQYLNWKYLLSVITFTLLILGDSHGIIWMRHSYVINYNTATNFLLIIRLQLLLSNFKITLEQWLIIISISCRHVSYGDWLISNKRN